MQYTGLKDMTKKDMYEDDIVWKSDFYVNKFNIFKVVWSEVNRISGWYLQNDFTKRTESDIPLINVSENEYLKVMGNIHENPNLLRINI